MSEKSLNKINITHIHIFLPGGNIVGNGILILVSMPLIFLWVGTFIPLKILQKKP